MRDISYNTEKYGFSYRVAGICRRDGYVLLQKPDDDVGHAFPGGQVGFGETHEQALKREFREEMGLEISVGEIRWLGELFYNWSGRQYTQLCLYYTVENMDDMPLEAFVSKENPNIKFYWVPVDDLNSITVYPEQAHALLSSNKVVHHGKLWD